MKDLTPENVLEAYTKAIEFFRAHPEKWTYGSMYVSYSRCMCLAGAMADQLGSDDILVDGWKVNDYVGQDLKGPQIWSINDPEPGQYSTTAAAIERAESMLRPFLESQVKG